MGMVVLMNMSTTATIGDPREAQVLDYQDLVRRTYKSKIGLPSGYAFSSCVSIDALPPIDTVREKVFIIGAYPSAVFKGGVPTGNLLKPFDPTPHAGKVNKSAQELKTHYLEPLGLTREDCWTTNLVKVFLFKYGHTRKLADPGAHFGSRDEFDDLATLSLPWIGKELEIARPRLIITLGAEVAGVVRDVSGDKKRVALIDYKIQQVAIGVRTYRVLHMVHPGQLIRKHPKWTSKHAAGVAVLKQEIRDLLIANPPIQAVPIVE